MDMTMEMQQETPEKKQVPDRLIVCTDGHRPAIADWAKDKMKACDVEYVRVSAVRDALSECVNVMEIQEQRETEDFHLSQAAFRPMWDAAKAKARAALALVDGNQETK